MSLFDTLYCTLSEIIANIIPQSLKGNAILEDANDNGFWILHTKFKSRFNRNESDQLNRLQTLLGGLQIKKGFKIRNVTPLMLQFKSLQERIAKLRSLDTHTVTDNLQNLFSKIQDKEIKTNFIKCLNNVAWRDAIPDTQAFEETLRDAIQIRNESAVLSCDTNETSFHRRQRESERIRRRTRTRTSDNRGRRATFLVENSSEEDSSGENSPSESDTCPVCQPSNQFSYLTADSVDKLRSKHELTSEEEQNLKKSGVCYGHHTLEGCKFGKKCRFNHVSKEDLLQ